MPLPPPRILILTALLPEARPLAQALGLKRISLRRWENERVCLEVIGLGIKRLPEVTGDIGGIVMAGLGGGLLPGLKIGEVVIDSPATPVHTTEKVLATVSQKREVFQKTGAHVVDMETQGVRQFAAEKGVAFISMRAISDTAAEELDPAFLQLVNEWGEVHAGRVMALLLLKPWKIGGLLRLKRNSQMALKNLSAAVKGLIDSDWPTKNG